MTIYYENTFAFPRFMLRALKWKRDEKKEKTYKDLKYDDKNKLFAFVHAFEELWNSSRGDKPEVMFATKQNARKTRNWKDAYMNV